MIAENVQGTCGTVSESGRGGWGWKCHACSTADWHHGATREQAIEALVDHTEDCEEV